MFVFSEKLEFTVFRRGLIIHYLISRTLCMRSNENEREIKGRWWMFRVGDYHVFIKWPVNTLTVTTIGFLSVYPVTYLVRGQDDEWYFLFLKFFGERKNFHISLESARKIRLRLEKIRLRRSPESAKKIRLRLRLPTPGIL